MRNINIIRIAVASAIILLIPLVAMQFTDAVNWTAADFLVMGVLLFGSGLTYELIARRGSTVAYRVALGVAVAAGLLLIWLNLAVGLIGSEDNPANLLYLGVLAVGLIGAAGARLQPRGMARAMYATALAQFLVPLIALIIWKSMITTEEGPGVAGVFLLNGFFVALFAVSGLLFKHASDTLPNRARNLCSSLIR